MISFELARRFGTFDYNSFCHIYLGRFAFLFEVGYLATLLLSLSVVSAASAALINEALGLPALLGHALFIVCIALLTFVGRETFERAVSIWSVFFYLVYGAMFAVVFVLLGGRILETLGTSSVDPAGAAWAGISYSGYNIVLIPILIFVAREFRSRREALSAGAIAGPVVMIPAGAFILALSAFHPEVIEAPLPIRVILEVVQTPLLASIVQIMVFGALVTTGAALLYGLNERMARAFDDRGAHMSRLARPAVATAAVLFAVIVASGVGLVDLIRHGYRFSSLFFTLVFVIPVLTIGLARLIAPGKRATPEDAPEKL